MTDIIRLKQQEAVLRLLFQNGHKDVEKRLRAQKNVATKRDCLTISSEAMEIQKTAQIYGQSENISLTRLLILRHILKLQERLTRKRLRMRVTRLHVLGRNVLMCHQVKCAIKYLQINIVN